MSKRKRDGKAPKTAPQSDTQTVPAKPSRRGQKAGALAAGALIIVATVWIGLRNRPAAEVPSPERTGAVRFETPNTGIDFALNNGTTDDKPIPDSTLGGVAVLDCDNDGLLDAYFTNGARFPDLVKGDPSFHNRLYRNLGDRRFEDATRQAGVEGHGYSMGAAAGDFDNDGWEDVFVAGLNRNTLFRNRGGCRFEDVTEMAGVDGPAAKPWSVAAAWLDYDNDGDLDLFVVNYLHWNWGNNRVCGDPGRRLSCSPAHYDGLPNALYRNRGDGTFEDVSRSSGIAAHIGKGMSAAVADYDSDGLADIFVANDSVRNFLFRNIDGERFEEVGVQTGVAFNSDGIPVSSMGADFQDLDGDGHPDLVITALTNETYPLFLNGGNGAFSDATFPTGIGLASFTMSGWSVGAFDFDNDGTREIFTANSHVSENIELYRDQPYRLPNAIFQRGTNGMYRDVGPLAGDSLSRSEAHRGAAFGDLDNDGRIDAIVSVIGAQAEVLFNASDAGNWLILDLQGTASNRSGIGARIRLRQPSGRIQHAHCTTAVGYASSSDSRIHFGLEDDPSASEVEIRWPSGRVQVLTEVPARQVLAVAEPG